MKQEKVSAFTSGKIVFLPSFPDESNLFASILSRMEESKPRANWQKLNQG